MSAAQEVLTHVTLVVDRFHVARHERDVVDTLCKREVLMASSMSSQANQCILPFEIRLTTSAASPVLHLAVTALRRRFGAPAR